MKSAMLGEHDWEMSRIKRERKRNELGDNLIFAWCCIMASLVTVGFGAMILVCIIGAWRVM